MFSDARVGRCREHTLSTQDGDSAKGRCARRSNSGGLCQLAAARAKGQGESSPADQDPSVLPCVDIEVNVFPGFALCLCASESVHREDVEMEDSQSLDYPALLSPT